VTWPCFHSCSRLNRKARPRPRKGCRSSSRASATAAAVRTFLPALHRELIEVISKYTKVNADDIKISLDRQGNLEVLDVNVVLPDA
jgi:cell division topological specificity factor